MPRISLRPIRISDAEVCFRWVSDPDVHRFLGLLQPARTLEQERAWIAGILADKEHQRGFIVEDEDGRPIGTCGLRGIDSEAGTAFLGIMIGEKRLWDKGYGTVATSGLLEYAFHDLGLREVRLSCHRDNRRALRCYEKAGFRPSSRKPERGRVRLEDVQMAVEREAWLPRRDVGEDGESAGEPLGREDEHGEAEGRGGRSSRERVR
jgi:RimJ/RimL family protein N-acetyltransferase